MNYAATDIDVNAYYFAGKEMKSFPRRISVEGEPITFADGVRVRLERGGRLTYLFNMLAEGGRTYRLMQDGNHWTLMGVR